MNKTKQTAKYVLADFSTAFIAWGLFFIYRKFKIEPYYLEDIQNILQDTKLYLGLMLVPLFWLTTYTLSGYYRKIYRKSRLEELKNTFAMCFSGVLVLFFLLILDDFISNYKNYYQAFFVLFGIHFTLTYAFRFIITTTTAHKIHNRIIGFRTIIIGSNHNAVNIYTEIENQKVSNGNKFVGFVTANGEGNYPLNEFLPRLGSFADLKNVITKHNIEEVIIAIEENEHKKIQKIITELEDHDVVIKIIPDMQDILVGAVKMSSIYQAPLILISPDLMPAWQLSVKRFLDILTSSICLILLSPLLLFLAFGVKRSSKGPVFYSHIRIGYKGRPFRIYKFRSMYIGSENGTPLLSSKEDPRITNFGRFMRKYRLDELPQFYNVLIGNMSLVGPRPERQHFIDEIVKRAPQYKLLHKVKPGITSWGQVKFGYAENVDQMIERTKFDLLYIENMSLATDVKILLYTILIIIKGDGQ